MRQPFVFAGQRRGRHLRHHKTGIEAGIGRKKCWQAFIQRRIHQALNASLRNSCQSAQRDSHVIQRKGQRLTVEVFARRLGSPLDSIIAAINSALNLENVENTFYITGAKIDNGYELALTPRTPAMKRIFQKLNLRIDGNLRVERTDMLHVNGDRIVTSYSNQTRAPLPPSIFEFTPPPGTDITTPLGR